MAADTDTAPAATAAPPLSPSSSDESLPAPSLGRGLTGIGGYGTGRNVSTEVHPSGKKEHGTMTQIMRGAAFTIYFVSGCLAITLTQLIGAPLYWVDHDLYYAYMAMTKRSFGLLITTMTRWWGPTVIRISGDASVDGQILLQPDGRVSCFFPERLVLIANHQIYTDWLYLWWVGYANRPGMHGHLYIILKESLKWIPFIGWGMMFYGFIFMSRKMAVDQPRMAHRLQKLKTRHTDPRTGKSYLDPMWLLLFPEGTNLSGNGRVKSRKWADKVGIRDPEHLMLPRSTGMYFCLQELKGSVDYVYDCTVAYEGIPRGKYGEDYFTLSSTYFAGRPPKSVNLYWRRFRIDEIPLESAEKFELWLRERFYEKDALMERYLTEGRFPPSEYLRSLALDGAPGGSKDGFLETEVRPKYTLEVLQVYSVLGAVGVAIGVLLRMWYRFWGLFGL